MKTKIYIAGKITGEPDYKQKFSETEEYFKTIGYAVLNPADLPSGMSPADYMRICLAMVDTADAIYLLPNHIDSKGAEIELRYAEYIGKRILYDLTMVEGGI